MAERKIGQHGPVLVYCVEGKRYGTGHHSRARLLSEAIPRHLGISSTLATSVPAELGEPTPGQEESMAPHAFFAEVTKQANASAACAVVLDVPWWNSDFMREEERRVLSEINVPLIGVDGPLEDNSVFDLVFLPTFLPPQNRTTTHSRFRFGWDCYLLRNRASSPRAPVANSVLIATGGSDVARLGQIWPLLLDKHLPPGTEVTWIQGPLAEAPTIPKDSKLNFRVARDPANIPELMGEASFGLTVHGVTFFEMLASGIPSVTYSPYGMKDQRELLTLQDMEIAQVGIDPEDAVLKLSELLGDSASAQSFSELARLTLSTPGEETFAAELGRLLRGVK